MANSIKASTKGNFQLPHGIQTHLARQAGISPQLINDYLHGRKNASAPIANRLAAIISSDIRIWLLGGNHRDRIKAVLK